MVKRFFRNIGLFVLIFWLTQASVLAQTGDTEPKTPAQATFKSRCENANPACANSPSECGSERIEIGKKVVYRTPFNCIFLQEPLGGRTGYDLYKATPELTPQEEIEINYTLWRGEAIVGNEAGPFQAVLAFEAGRELEGPFGLLYNYLGLVYNFLSGIIIAFVVLVAIVGGIRMTTSAGNQEAFASGRKMIIKALIGMVIWFAASVILYTINPTFFTF